MYGRHAFSLVPSVCNYAEAEALEASIKPVRGDAAGTKPLAERRKKFVSIRKGKDGEVVIKLYNTDILTYRKDGVIELQMTGHHTTREYVSSILETRCVSVHGKTWLGCTFEGDPDPGNSYLPIPYRTPTLLRRENYRYTILNPTFPVVRSINRQRATEARAPYAPFLKYLTGLVKVRGGMGFSIDERSALPLGDHAAEFMRSEHTEDWHIAALYVFHEESKWGMGMGYRPAPTPLAKVRAAALNTINSHHAREILDTTEVRTGKIVKDNYAGW